LAQGLWRIRGNSLSNRSGADKSNGDRVSVDLPHGESELVVVVFGRSQEIANASFAFRSPQIRCKLIINYQFGESPKCGCLSAQRPPWISFPSSFGHLVIGNRVAGGIEGLLAVSRSARRSSSFGG
jgi:hypothetical protein